MANGRQAPLVSNPDQGSQFTSPGDSDAVESAGAEVSLDGVGRGMDNRFIQRWWWSTKEEDVYRNDCGDGRAAGRGLTHWFKRSHTQRPHQSLDNATPAECYWPPQSQGGQAATWAALQAPRPQPTQRPPGGLLITPDSLSPDEF